MDDRPGATAPPGKRNTVLLHLPPQFVELCTRHKVEPALVLRGFIADLCSIEDWHSPTGAFVTNGSDERHLAQRYYERVGYEWRAEYVSPHEGPA